MDAKLTLSFNQDIINKAKAFADKNNISLSRLVEYLLAKVVDKPYQSLEDFPISDWVNIVADGQALYQTKSSRKKQKDEFFSAKK
jgi:hypothetical protein